MSTRETNLSEVDQLPASSTTLRIAADGPRDLEGLRRFRKLHTLELAFRDHKRPTLDALAALPLLRTLTVNTCFQPHKLAGLGALSLTHLTLAELGHNLRALPPLPSSLEELRIQWTHLRTLAGIERLTMLRILTLEHVHHTGSKDGYRTTERCVEDVSALDGHPALRVIASHDSMLPATAFPKSVRWCVTTVKNPKLHQLAKRKPPLGGANSKPTSNSASARPEIGKVMTLLQAKSRETVDQAVELVRSLDDGWDRALDGVRYDALGERTVRSELSGPYNVHATLALLATAPKSCATARAIREQVTVLGFKQRGGSQTELHAWTFAGFPKLRRIHLEGVALCAGDRPSALPALERVTLLHVGTNRRYREFPHAPPDLAWLSAAAAVEELDIIGANLDLAHLPALRPKRIRLTEVKAKDWSALGSLGSLESLDLQDKCFDLAPSRHLGPMPKLRELWIHTTLRVDSLDFLAGMPALETIKLDLRSIKNLEPLYSHPRLKRVYSLAFGKTDKKRLAARGVETGTLKGGATW